MYQRNTKTKRLKRGEQKPSESLDKFCASTICNFSVSAETHSLTWQIVRYVDIGVCVCVTRCGWRFLFHPPASETNYGWCRRPNARIDECHRLRRCRSVCGIHPIKNSLKSSFLWIIMEFCGPHNVRLRFRNAMRCNAALLDKNSSNKPKTNTRRNRRRNKHFFLLVAFAYSPKRFLI